MEEKIFEFIENKNYPDSLLKKVWEILFDKWEEFPEDCEEAKSIVLDELSTADKQTLKKIYNKIFKDEEE